MRPKAPGLYISKWREEGPVSIETAEEWRENHGWKDWMPIIEAALYLDAAELVELLLPELTPAQRATFDLVRRRMLGDQRLEDAIDKALEVCRNPETRDLALEGRLRMERGLQRFEKGDSHQELKRISHGQKPDLNRLQRRVGIMIYHSSTKQHTTWHPVKI